MISIYVADHRRIIGSRAYLGMRRHQKCLGLSWKGLQVITGPTPPHYAHGPCLTARGAFSLICYGKLYADAYLYSFFSTKSGSHHCAKRYSNVSVNVFTWR